MEKIKTAILLVGVLVLTGCAGSAPENKKSEEEKTKTVSGDYITGELKSAGETAANQTKENNMETKQEVRFAEIETSLGKIKLKLYAQSAPLTVENFLKLANQKFYDGTKFHRVIKGFMIQGGDPNSKTDNTATWGMGGPGYQFKDELKGTEKYPQGTLAMANSGPNTNGSQFFIVTASPAAPLPPSYTVFGEVVSGLDVALKIENVKTVPGDRPVENVVIKTISESKE